MYLIQIEMKEQDRLASTISLIDNEVAVVPKGAFIRTPLGEVVQNKAFQGKNYYLMYSAG